MRRSLRLRKFLREQIVPLAVIILLLCSFKSAIADWNIVPTGSMNPSIVEGDRILVNKLAYGLKVPFTTWHLAHWSAPARGDVITFRSPKDGTVLVKRVVALPGDRVAMRDEQLIVNGTAATNGPLATSAAADLSPLLRGKSVFASETLSGQTHAVMSTPALPAMRNFGPLVVPQGEYFVLGDNRDNSADSRYIGSVPRDNILGRSSRIVLSIDPESHLPRLHRTLRDLK
jgi:signal peptidase I